MRNTLIALALVTLLLAAGCASRLTKENYDKLKIGMSYAEVTEILGKADTCAETLGISNCTWGKDGPKTVSVIFLADQATAFSHKGLQ